MGREGGFLDENRLQGDGMHYLQRKVSHGPPLNETSELDFEGTVTRVFHVIASWRAGKTDLKSDRRKEGKDDLSAGQGSTRVRFDD